MSESEPSQRAERLRLILALEIDRILHHLTVRRAFLFKQWTRARAREPFLDTLFSRWRTVNISDLVLLDEPTLVAVESFYDHLFDLRLWLSHTADMPVTLEERFDLRVAKMAVRGREALACLGGVPPHPDRPEAPPFAHPATLQGEE